MRRLKLNDGREIHFKPASAKDVPAIIGLYNCIYHGHYTLREVTDPEIARQKVEDPSYFWLLALMGQEVVGSVIFAVDPVNKLGKCFGAAVLGEFRGQDVMHTMIQQGVERLTHRTRSCDIVYGTTRTVSPAPAQLVEHLGFHPMGIFPNVRKVESFETHGLEIFFRKGCLDIRRQKPVLIPELREFYRIVQDLLRFEDHEEIELEAADPRKMGKPVVFHLERDEQKVLQLYRRYQDKDVLDKVFFPFTDPDLLFVSEDQQAEFFVNFNVVDGHAVVLGYRVQDPDLRRMLMWFCESASQVGMRYIELIVNAFKPEMQRIASDARFLPCAYFPAMRMNDMGLREDYIVFSRSFEQLDFMDMHLVGPNRRFLDAFMKCWYEMLVRCQPDFDDGGFTIG
jgi:hypothetical protein